MMHATPNDSARPAPLRTITAVSLFLFLIVPPFRLSCRLGAPRDSFDLPPRPSISKRTAARRTVVVVVDMSPLIEGENSTGINTAINRAERIQSGGGAG